MDPSNPRDICLWPVDGELTFESSLKIKGNKWLEIPFKVVNKI